jgi:hypothetical protein
MVNTENLLKGSKYIDYYGLNASAFADKMAFSAQVCLTFYPRNKSLDFILKILDVFPDVDLYWMINGKGSFPKKRQ